MNSQLIPLKGAVLMATLTIAFLSCSSKPEQGTIKGNLKNFKDSFVYLDEITTISAKPKDSVKVDAQGNFSLKFETKEPSFYRIRLSENNYILLIIDEKEQIEFNADANNLGKTAQVKGSNESAKLFEATHQLQSNAERLDSLNGVFQREQGNPALDSIKTVLQNKYNKMLEDEEVFIKSFIDKNSSSLACLAIIDKLSPDEHFAYYTKLDAGLNKAHPTNSYTKMFHDKVVEMGRLNIGATAPDISLNTPDGKNIALSSLKGKVVLVDFWASWCRPCRAENPNVVRMYNTYKDKGFEVYSVSLDKDKEPWIKAIADDHLIWPSHVSDLGYWQSSVVKQYNISGIPYTCLLDREGKIVAKGLRGEELEQKIKELLQIK
ncbi:MAG TPA: TlpA disulfide reductase family protein [Bacteroidia bacterium]|nr:TlpA disulfide reductase family protein [Bacteroidia bacterium]